MFARPLLAQVSLGAAARKTPPRHGCCNSNGGHAEAPNFLPRGSAATTSQRRSGLRRMPQAGATSSSLRWFTRSSYEEASTTHPSIHPSSCYSRAISYEGLSVCLSGVGLGLGGQGGDGEREDLRRRGCAVLLAGPPGASQEPLRHQFALARRGISTCEEDAARSSRCQPRALRDDASKSAETSKQRHKETNKETIELASERSCVWRSTSR